MRWAPRIVTPDEIGALRPGEFLASGTTAGQTGLEIGRFPQSGDFVELIDERIGTLGNRLVQLKG